MLLLKSPEDVQAEDSSTLQVVASVIAEHTITIIIRRDVAGITVCVPDNVDIIRYIGLINNSNDLVVLFCITILSRQ